MADLRPPALVYAACLVTLAGCSANSPSLPNEQRATGISAHLAKRTGAPLWNIELVGTIQNAWKNVDFQLPAHGKIVLVGWAVDQNAKSAAGGVELAIDDIPYGAKYGTPRKDVAIALGVPSYAASGFSFVLDADEFAPGQHVLFFRVLASDKTGYWEAGPYTLDLN
jgi:hypothetical protein